MVRGLPIDPLLPAIVEELRRGTRLVLRADPGAGKTTRVPAALLDAGIAGAGEILVVEPRRIAARAAAEFVAEERGGRVGGDIGYRVRFESRGGAPTRLWFVTEGVFSRRLVSDPYLEDVGVVVLDEFHERRLGGDVALGIVKELQETVRPELRLVVMSATLETAPLARFLGDCPVLTSEGRVFPVTVEHEEASSPRVSERVAAVLHRELAADPGGDVLVFLPGAGAIRRTAEAVSGLAVSSRFDVVPLHGDLPLETQRRAITPGPRRKVVLATNVAETSLTIDGVKLVVDTGLARETRFDPRHGLNRLEEVRISRASAAQRAGRAGRTAPGRCIRLWGRADHEGRRERETPECLRLDLSGAVLELRARGIRDPRVFSWLDRPGDAAFESAERLLRALGAVGADGAPTTTGLRMLELPVEPRLARILVEAERRDSGGTAALLAALASERDILLERRVGGRVPFTRASRDPFPTGRGLPVAGPWPAGPSDLLLRLELFREAERTGFDRRETGRLGLDPGALRAVERARAQLARAVDAAGKGNTEAWLRCVLAGFPDRVARRRTPGSARAVMTGGTGVVLDASSVVREEELFVAVDLDAGPRRERAEAHVRIASAVRREWLGEMFPDSLREERETVLDPSSGRVVERRRELYADLVLGETVRSDPSPSTASELLAEAVRRDPAPLLENEDLATLIGRLRFLYREMPEQGLPAADELLAMTIEAAAEGRRSLEEIRRADLCGVALGFLGRHGQRLLEREAPATVPLPSGRRARVVYEPDRPPRFAARIQEIFGMTATPRIAGGRVRLRVEILAPNRRPVQVTDDLESFWRRTYPEVRKQLRGRYPKHSWPESPGPEDSRRR